MIDEVFKDIQNYFRIPTSKIRQVQLTLIRDSFSWHFERCQSYQNYCLTEGFTPDKITKFEDIVHIPLIPSIVFKNVPIMSVPESEIFRKCTSSGTKGGVSLVYRDYQTLEAFAINLRTCSQELLKLQGEAFVLGPPVEQAKDLWISFVMTLVGRRRQVNYMIQNNTFLIEELVNGINDKSSPKVIIGPPFLLLRICNHIKEKGLKVTMHHESRIVAAGGWKKFSGEAIPRDTLEEIINLSLGVQKVNIRDGFNMVELNTAICECEYKTKHVPPWLRVTARDPITLKEVNGKLGLLGYIDCTAKSYPCFILTDDIGYVKEETSCPCGRTGQEMEIIGRISAMEPRGCALKLDRLLQGV